MLDGIDLCRTEPMPFLRTKARQQSSSAVLTLAPSRAPSVESRAALAISAA